MEHDNRVSFRIRIGQKVKGASPDRQNEVSDCLFQTRRPGAKTDRENAESELQGANQYSVGLGANWRNLSVSLKSQRAFIFYGSFGLCLFSTFRGFWTSFE